MNSRRLPTTRERSARKRPGNRRLRRASWQHIRCAKRQFWRWPLPQRIAKGVADDLVDHRLVLEPDFRFGRVNVHVDAIGRHLEEQVHLGTAFLVRRNAVRIENRVRERLGRFDERLTHVAIHVSDVNGPRGNGLRATLEARVNGLDPLAVTGDGATVDRAVMGATSKAARAIDHRLGKLADRAKSAPAG